MTTNRGLIKNHDTKCPHDRRVSCGNCRLNTICLPISRHIDDIDKLNNIVQRGKPLQKDDYLYGANNPFESVYAMRPGALKANTISDNGGEQVTGFYRPGEVVGMDGIADDRYANSVRVRNCIGLRSPFSRMKELGLQIPSLQRHFFN